MSQPSDSSQKQLHGLDADLAEKANLKMELDSEMVKEALKWIGTVTGEKTEGDFWEVLKSGVLLCKLINSLRPGMIQRINLKEQVLYERENIKLYLEACTRLGLAHTSLFQIDDLHSKKYLPAVLHNILDLSKLADARKMLGDVLVPRSKAAMRHTHRRSLSAGNLWKESNDPNPSLSYQASQRPVTNSDGRDDAAPAVPKGMRHSWWACACVFLRSHLTDAAAVQSAPALPSRKEGAKVTFANAPPPGEKTPLDAFMEKVRERAALNKYEFDADMATLRKERIVNVEQLAALCANDALWAHFRLPVLTKLAIEQLLQEQQGVRARRLSLMIALPALVAAGFFLLRAWKKS